MTAAGAILSKPNLTPAQKLILLALSIRQGRANSCRTSLSLLARDTHLSMSATVSAINVLVEQREISRVRKRNCNDNNDINTYSVVVSNNVNRRRNRTVVKTPPSEPLAIAG